MANHPHLRALRIYTAGPYRADNAYRREQNIRVAEAAALGILHMGALPICPHTMFRFFQGAVTDHVALRAGLDLLRSCDAVLLLPGHEHSQGTLDEHRLARALGLAIFDRESALRAWVNQQHRQGLALDLRADPGEPGGPSPA